MCDGYSAALAIIAIASTAAEITAQNKQAEAESKAATNAAIADYNQQNEQQHQINQQNAAEKAERAKQAMMERAALRVSQGESGLAGLSHLKELGAVDQRESYDLSILETNRANRVRQVEVEKEGTLATAQGRTNIANSKMVSNAMAGLQIGMSGATGAMQGYSYGKSINKG